MAPLPQAPAKSPRPARRSSSRTDVPGESSVLDATLRERRVRMVNMCEHGCECCGAVNGGMRNRSALRSRPLSSPGMPAGVPLHGTDGVADDAEMYDNADAEEQARENERRRRRRPDRRPFTANLSFPAHLASVRMPSTDEQSSVVVGEPFWRLAAYVDSVPAREEERLAGRRRAPHVLVRGPPSSGKTFLLAASAAILGRPDLVNDEGSSDARAARGPRQHTGCHFVHLGDANAWLAAPDSARYFLAAVTAGLAVQRGRHAPFATPGHALCADCVSGAFEHGGSSVEGCLSVVHQLCAWMRKNRPDTLLVFVVDQAEALDAALAAAAADAAALAAAKPAGRIVGRGGRVLVKNTVSASPAAVVPLAVRVVRALIADRLPLVVFGLTDDVGALPPVAPFGPDALGAARRFSFAGDCGVAIDVPYRMRLADFSRLVEAQHTLVEDSCPHTRDPAVWRDVRMWTGGVPGAVVSLLATGVSPAQDANALPSVVTRIAAFRRGAVCSTQQVAGLDAAAKARVLAVIFSTILRLPLRYTDAADTDATLTALGTHIGQHILLSPLQTFYRASAPEGVYAVRGVPAARGLASFLALSSRTLLSALDPRWERVFEALFTRITRNALREGYRDALREAICGEGAAGTKSAARKTQQTKAPARKKAVEPVEDVCAEVARRTVRFYVHARVLWDAPGACPPAGRDLWEIDGSDADGGASVRLSFCAPRVVFFAGQTPAKHLFMADGEDHAEAMACASRLSADVVLGTSGSAEAGGCSSRDSAKNKQCDAVVFLPGYSSYRYFDLFVWQPAERRVCAITTSTHVSSWVRDLSAAARTQSTRRVYDGQLGQLADGVMTPAIVLDQWRDTLRKSFAGALSADTVPVVRCVHVRAADLVRAFASPCAADARPDAGEVSDLVSRLAVLSV